MATFVKYNAFIQNLGRGVIDLDADVLKIALTNTAPNAATHGVLADITEIAAGNGYSAGGSVVANNAFAQVTGTGTLTGDDVVFTAAGGAIASFRYAVLYSDTPTAPADPLIAYWDYGSSIAPAAGETFTVDFGASILTIA